jgi:hypothetical protein
MAEFLELLEEGEFYNVLDKAKDAGEIMSYLKAYESK